MYIVITKTYAELRRPKTDLGFPGTHPAECVEVKTREEANIRYPGRPVMLISEYNIFIKELKAAHAANPPKKWWKLW